MESTNNRSEILFMTYADVSEKLINVHCAKEVIFSGGDSHSVFAKAGSNRSSQGGNEVATR